MKADGVIQSLSFALENELKSENRRSKVLIAIEGDAGVSIQVFENGVRQECPMQMINVARDAFGLVEEYAQSLLNQEQIAS